MVEGAYTSPPRRRLRRRSSLPQKRATPDSRETVSSSRSKKPVNHSKSDAETLPDLKSDTMETSTSTSVSHSQQKGRPTPDSSAFKRLGELRRRPHSSGSLSFTPTHKTLCPPTPKRSQLSLRRAVLHKSHSEQQRPIDSHSRPGSEAGGYESPLVLTPHERRWSSPCRKRVMFSSRLSEDEKHQVFSSVKKIQKKTLGNNPLADHQPNIGTIKSHRNRIRAVVTRSMLQQQHCRTVERPRAREEAVQGAKSERKPRSEEELENLIPHLEFVETIGRGSSAVVSIVQERESKELFALKVNSEQFVETNASTSFNQFHFSTLVWALLGEGSSHVVPVYCAWSEPGWINVQMELCRGGNLLDYVDMCMKDEAGEPTRPWQEDQVWRCLGDAAEGLSHIHSSGFCHNDIKPGNLFVGKKHDVQEGWKVMIGDFGNARKHRALFDGDEGDFRYLSKEALQSGKSEFASDVFSLGISFYEVVADVILPEIGMWHQLREGKIPPLPDHFSEDLYNLLCEMMHPEPKKRPKASDIVSHPLVLAHRQTQLPVLDRFKDVQIKQQHVERSPPLEERSIDVARTPDHATSVFVTTPLAESLMNDVQQWDSRPFLNRESLSPTTQENVEDDATASPRRCLLSYFDDMECQKE